MDTKDQKLSEIIELQKELGQKLDQLEKLKIVAAELSNDVLQLGHGLDAKLLDYTKNKPDGVYYISGENWAIVKSRYPDDDGSYVSTTEIMPLTEV